MDNPISYQKFEGLTQFMLLREERDWLSIPRSLLGFHLLSDNMLSLSMVCCVPRMSLAWSHTVFSWGLLQGKPQAHVMMSSNRTGSLGPDAAADPD